MGKCDKKRSITKMNINNNTTKKLFDVPSLANYLSISPNAVYVMVSKKKIDSSCIIKMGKSLKFDVARVDEWLERLRTESMRKE
jgi:predicted DNA-binding transcriptional regulator AlpA